MKKFLRTIGIIVLIIVVVIAGFVGYMVFEDARKNAQVKKLKMKVIYDIETCSKEYPLVLVVNNGSDKTIESIDIAIEVRRKGYSTNLNDWGWLDYKSDKIIKPNEIHGSFWRYKLKAWLLKVTHLPLAPIGTKTKPPELEWHSMGQGFDLPFCRDPFFVNCIVIV